MRIATLQFAPKLGDVQGNIERANALLEKGKPISLGDQTPPVGIGLDLLRPDVLVLPELALTGYNFPSLDAIKPYLELAGSGPSAAWARETAKRLQCKVCVGYPEIESSSTGTESDQVKYYNSLLVVDEGGKVIHNYRKNFLYFTDDTWAAEGNVERGFHELTFQAQDLTRAQEVLTDDIHRAHSIRVATSFGICMDINPYKFEAPYTAWEFANRVLDSQSQLVIISMAWLTLLTKEELAALEGQPEMDTFNYWLNRFYPLIEKQMQHTRDLDGEDGPKKVEPAADDTKPPARYAGTSAVIAVTQRPRSEPKGSRVGGQENSIDVESAFDVKILCWDLLGAAEEGICFADTTGDPKMVFGLRSRSGPESKSDSDSDLDSETGSE
ncbi:Carbon-nitrogen hydrolase [Penicillium maclennaniae]|uniref:Carbon-nitrogen hydrolase n=1 Tax=Penicillium maclennaniae TaxID=1343394 RepID=UPI00254131A8|nr:Carbon-nitrogen hydrolase [Penicillium maclennaniae]KAJ5665328.1 Carbon-nitrogen hydrolase [Penicillium maclennaniae]